MSGALVGVGLRAAALFAVGDAAAVYGDRGRYIAADQNLTFPADISDAYIHMRFSEYTRRSIREQPFYNPLNSIRLPIPSKLVDTTSVTYSTESLGPVYGMAAEAVASAGFNRQTGALPNLYNFGAAVGAEAVSALPSRAQGALTSATGLAVNPYQTTTFKTPEFKTHSFSWKFTPNNKPESDILERIIRIFKYHSSPALSATGSFFTYPEILEIRIFPNDEYLYKFKPCVVKNVSVDYAPAGPSFYRGSRAPTAIGLSIELQEIELWTKADYFRTPRGVPQPVSSVNQPNLAPRS
jgi:hypothetical protein